MNNEIPACHKCAQVAERLGHKIHEVIEDEGFCSLCETHYEGWGYTVTP